MKDQLSKYITFVSENKRHWTFRCPYCGDSKTSSHGHLNIAKDMPVFRCVRCGQDGHIKALLNFLNANDVVIPEFINEGKYSKKKHKTNNVKFDEPLEQYIEDYLKGRLQTTTIPSELNIISSNTLSKLVYNAQNEYGKQQSFTKCIPFLSYRGRKVISRILDNDKFRYYIYSLMDGNDFYVIKNKRKYSEYRKHNTIIIAEGTFDIANQYIHRFVNTPDDAIYMCANNQNFSAAFNLARSIALCYSPNIILLADQDIDSSVYKKVVEKYRLKKLKIYKNKQGKDFGDFPVEPYLDLEI
jgi:transcription elongation factor Elf1